MDAILNRRAVRKYSDEAVEQDKIEKLVAAFQAAPCGMHQMDVMQATVVTKPELLAKVEENIGNTCYGAPLLFVINTKKGNQFGERDASVAAENVMIEATDLGLGSVYVMGGAAQLNSHPDLQKELGIDEGFETTVIVAVGKAADKPELEDRSHRYKVVMK